MHRDIEGEVFGCERVGNARGVLTAAHVRAVLAGLDDDVVARLGVLAERESVDLGSVDFIEVVGDDFLQAPVTFDASRFTEIKLVQPVVLLTFTAGDRVEVFLDGSGELVVDERGEVVLEQTDDRERRPRGNESGAFLADVVAAVDHRRDDRCPRRGTANAFFFEALDEAGLGVAGGGSGGVRVVHPFADEDGVALGEWGKKNRIARRFCIIVRVVVGQVFVCLAVALLRDRGAARRELTGGRSRGRREFHADRHSGGVGHLRCERALPDETVERDFLLRLQLAFDLLGCTQRQCGANRLVCFLGVLHLRREHARLGREHVVAVDLADRVTHLTHGFRGEDDGVGSHVGDEAVLVQALGDAHHLAAGQTQLAAGFLLQGARHERRLRRRAVRLVLDADDRERLARECGDEFIGTRFGDDDDVRGRVALLVEVLAGGDACAVERCETCRE